MVVQQCRVSLPVFTVFVILFCFGQLKSRTMHATTLVGPGRDLKADLGVIFWKVDDQICLQFSALTIGHADDLQNGGFSSTTVHTSSGGSNSEGWVRIRTEASEVILKRHANGLNSDFQNAAWSEEQHKMV
jgi:hypothetical protein